MKKYLFSLILMLVSLTAFLEAKSENPMLPDFLEKEIDKAVSPAVVIAKHFFVNPEEFQKMLDKERKRFYLAYIYCSPPQKLAIF